MTAEDPALAELVAGCVEAMHESDPRGAVREVLDRAITDGSLSGGVESAAGLNILYRSSDLTVLNVIWPPKMFLMPHDHRMWAAIGIYGGREDNTFYRRDGDALVTSGGKELTDGAVLLLGHEVIHAVHNPSHSTYTGAIHVYGGDFVGTPRSQWDPATLEEQPYDLVAVQRQFDEAERAARGSGN